MEEIDKIFSDFYEDESEDVLTVDDIVVGNIISFDYYKSLKGGKVIGIEIIKDSFWGMIDGKKLICVNCSGRKNFFYSEDMKNLKFK